VRQSDGKRVSLFGFLSSDLFRPVFDAAVATHMFTFATWEGIYCLYPQLTLQKRESVIFEFGRNRQDELESYADCMKYVPVESVSGLGEWQKRRSTGDKYVLRIGFRSTLGRPGGLECLSIEVSTYLCQRDMVTISMV
jgi:hypothetical protein